MPHTEDVFTITLIVDGDNSKLLLSTSETPAKEDSEASGVLYKEDLPEQFEEIISKIPIFTTAIEEEGSEESVTHTMDDFLELYDLDLNQIIEVGEEILNVDLDDDDESEEGSEHIEKLDLDEADPFGIYGDSPKPGDALSHIDPREALEEFPVESEEYFG